MSVKPGVKKGSISVMYTSHIIHKIKVKLNTSVPRFKIKIAILSPTEIGHIVK